MLREISDGVIQSSDGFIVNNHGHFSLQYIEGDHVATFDVEAGMGGYIYYLDGPVRWEAPFEAEQLQPSRQNQIKDRIVAALKFRGYPVHIQR